MLFSSLQQKLVENFDDISAFEYVDFREIWPQESLISKDGGCIIFQDMDHFSACGEELLGQRLSEYFSLKISSNEAL